MSDPKKSRTGNGTTKDARCRQKILQRVETLTGALERQRANLAGESSFLVRVSKEAMFQGYVFYQVRKLADELGVCEGGTTGTASPMVLRSAKLLNKCLPTIRAMSRVSAERAVSAFNAYTAVIDSPEAAVAFKKVEAAQNDGDILKVLSGVRKVFAELQKVAAAPSADENARNCSLGHSARVKAIARGRRR